MREALNLIKIFLPKISKQKGRAFYAANRASKNSIFLRAAKGAKGFTLLEVMIVVALLAAITGVVLPSFTNSNSKIKSEIRRLSTLTRQVRNVAKLKNQTFRIAFDLKQASSTERELQQYWIESPSQNSPSGFAPDTSILKKPSTLSYGVQFEDIEITHLEEAVTEGLVYIHFFATGMTEEAAIHLSAKENRWTLAVHPLTGKSDIIANYVALKDLKQQ